jgi:hypothetical protein
VRCEARAQCATAMRIRRTLQCEVRRAAQCARGAAAGAAGASALAVVKGAAVELPQWRALLRPAAQRAYATLVCVRRDKRCSARPALQLCPRQQVGGLGTGGLRRWSPPPLRVHKAHTDARPKFDGERRRARRVPGVPGENPSPLETVSICVRPRYIPYNYSPI